MNQWKRIDKSCSVAHIAADDVCVVAREYYRGRGYEAGDTNQLVLNFKKGPKKRNTDEWVFRDAAVRRFAQEASILFSETNSCAVTSIPSSKATTDTDYDNRFEDMLGMLVKLRPKLVIEWPITCRNTTPAVHHGGRRDPAEIKQNYEWHGFQAKEPHRLYVFDDVVTSGAHFRAFSDFCRQNNYQRDIAGIFWARTLRPPASVDFSLG